jgi:hypothetical protein
LMDRIGLMLAMAIVGSNNTSVTIRRIPRLSMATISQCQLIIISWIEGNQLEPVLDKAQPDT